MSGEVVPTGNIGVFSQQAQKRGFVSGLLLVKGDVGLDLTDQFFFHHPNLLA